MANIMRLFLVILLSASASAEISFENDVAPVLNKYCAGCHNDDDSEGGLSLESFAALQKGGEHGPAVMAGDANASLLFRMINGDAEAKMPPDGEPAPSAAEIAILDQWIRDGAYGPSGNSLRIKKLVTPQIAPAESESPITALAISPDGKTVAIARFRSITLRNSTDDSLVGRLTGHAGKINSLAFAGNERLIAASGVTGLRGEIVEWDTKTLQPFRRIEGHRDIVYAAVPSPDGTLIASAGYDRSIIIWDRSTGESLRQLEGHNGAVFDLAFTPNGKILASASADATVKIWDVASGRRLDTLSQPLKEQYSVAISPDGNFVYACGEDNRIRKWRLVSRNEPKINPLLIARFGHEQSVERIRLSPDGRFAVTTSTDRTIKVWDADTLTQQLSFGDQPDSVQAIAIHPTASIVSLGRMDGSLDKIAVQFSDTNDEANAIVPATRSDSTASVEPQTKNAKFSDTEPNSDPAAAQVITLPAHVDGSFASNEKDTSDIDLFQFAAKAGEEWILELNAANESPVDPHVAVLHEDGRPVLRTNLQAVRDSYFTFRGKDSVGTGDFRLHNWREMKLNEYLYASGEVVKLYHYPRGPDSGFNVYPNFGKRFGYFDTTPVTHALGSPCYIVEPRSPSETITPNGLPVFPIFFENDDASDRSAASNSRLTFVAPTDGTYLIAARDVRGFHGDEYEYSLIVRRPVPDFEVIIETKDLKVVRSGGKKIDLKLKRIDGFMGEVHINIDNLPTGFAASNPTTFEREHLRAWAAITATSDAVGLAGDVASQSTVTATALIKGKEVTKEVGSLGKIELVEKAKLTVSLTATKGTPTILQIEPGTTVTANLKIERNDHVGSVSFGSEEALVNAPHGIYVDNIGLNGVLIPEGQTERTIFISAESWVQPTERWVFIQAGVSDNPTSLPILLRVVPRRDLAQRSTLN